MMSRSIWLVSGVHLGTVKKDDNVCFSLQPMTRWYIASNQTTKNTAPAEGDENATDRSSYHHGDLRRALIEAAAGLVEESGPAGFSLREVARRAGVSHAAPAHHFGSTKGLLTAVASEGFELLTAAMRQARHGVEDPADQLRAVGRAYVSVSLGNAGHAAVMFRSDIVDHDDEFFAACGLDSYGQLQQTIEAIRDTYNPDLDVELVCKLVWSTAQGIVTLHSDFGPLDERRDVRTLELTQLLDGLVDLLLDGIRPR